jgi:fibronectin type 3 domain-containing protein
MVLFAALAQSGCAGSSGVGVQPPQQPITYAVKLEWIESTSPVIGYNVYRGTESGGPYVLLSSSLVTGTQYEDSSVQPGQTYYYVVTAVDSSNVESTYSNQASATIP